MRGQQNGVITRGIEMPEGAVNNARFRQNHTRFGFEVGDDELALLTLVRGFLTENGRRAQI